MDGWKTWVAVIGMVLYGIGVEGIYNNNWASAVNYVLGALALLGIGGKLSKMRLK